MAAYLRLGNGSGMIKGTSKDPGHPGWIEVSGYQLGIRSTTSGGGWYGSGSSSASPNPKNEIYITKVLDAASTPLSLAFAKGTVFGESLLEAGGQAFVMKNAMISSYQVSPNTAGQVPSEAFSLNYEDMSFGSPRAAGAGAPDFSSAITALARAALSSIVK